MAKNKYDPKAARQAEADPQAHHIDQLQGSTVGAYDGGVPSPALELAQGVDEKSTRYANAADANVAAHGGLEGDDRKEAERFPRVVLTDGAVFYSNVLDGSIDRMHDVDYHHHCEVGDVVWLTDEEFAAHQAGGVCIVNREDREAA